MDPLKKQKNIKSKNRRNRVLSQNGYTINEGHSQAHYSGGIFAFSSVKNLLTVVNNKKI